MRINRPKQNAFDEVKIPQHQHYKPKSYLQVNKRKNHFRTLTPVGKQINVRDGLNEILKPQDQLNSLLNEDEWAIYIILYANIKNFTNLKPKD